MIEFYLRVKFFKGYVYKYLISLFIFVIFFFCLFYFRYIYDNLFCFIVDFFRVLIIVNGWDILIYNKELVMFFLMKNNYIFFFVDFLVIGKVFICLMEWIIFFFFY